MAKRHKGEEEPEEDYEFVPPDFDEDAFIHKEMVSFRTTLTLILSGIVAALVSWGIYAGIGGGDTGWWLGLLTFAATFGALRPLYRVLKFDISHYARKEWLGTGFLLFFTWLAFFMILVNPPFTDISGPQATLYVSPGVPADSEPMRIDAFISDNDAIKGFTFSIVDADGASVATKADLVRADSAHHGHYQWMGQPTTGQYTVTLTATDKSGHKTTTNHTFDVAPDPLQVDVGDLRSAQEKIIVRVPAAVNVWRVYADHDGNLATTDDRVWFKEDESFGGWIARASFRGWAVGEQQTHFVVEERHQFHEQTLVRGGVLMEGPVTVNVTAPGDYAKPAPKVPTQNTNPPLVTVPGPGFAIVAIGIVAAAVVIRRR